MEMKTSVEFRSSKFPPYDGEQEEINPGLWGKRLAQYMSQRLQERGIETDEIIMEDWGCYLPVRNDSCRLALCCGHQYGDDDEFLIFTDPKTPRFRKFLRTVDVTPQLTELTDTVRKILESDPDIRDIKWQDG